MNFNFFTNNSLTKEEQELFAHLHEEREHDAKTFNKPSYKGIWTGIVDKYKEKAHFVYELLQNADDAQATTAEFTLEQNRLVFRHDGKVHFSISSEGDIKNKGHINAITGVGNSTKNDTTGNTIGKFGVGFKAVFQYTNEPHIYDDKFWFKIENYIVPTALSTDFVGRKKGETIFEFPFFSPRDAFKEITQRLRTLNNPILFLRNLKKVTINTPDKKEIVYSKSIVESGNYGNIKHELLSVNNYGEISKIHMFTRGVSISNEGKNYQQYISVGYFLNSNDELDDISQRSVFCFFPTAENFNLKCVVHAPFLLVDSRQQLKDTEINTQLKRLLANLAAEALLLLRDYGLKHNKILISENLFNFIPNKNWIYNSDNIFRDAYLKVIRENNLLLSRKDKYISVKKALICHPISMMNILSDGQLTNLRNGYHEDSEETPEYLRRNRSDSQEWVFLRENTQRFCNQEYVKEIFDELGITVYNGENLAHDITANFMAENGLKWAKKLYSHLRNEQIGLWKRSENTKKTVDKTPFCLSPIILTSNGNWDSAYLNTGTLNIYLPLSSAAEGYNFVAADYLKDKDSISFLKDMGLNEPDAWDYIQSVVLKKYNEGGTITSDIINNDFEIVFEYVKKIKNYQEKQDKINILKDAFHIVCEDNYFRSANGLYDDNVFLKKYFSGNKDKFIDSSFYKPFIDKYSKQDFNDFISLLGICSIPKVEKFNRSYLPYDEKVKAGIKNYTWCSIDDHRIDGFEKWNPKNIEESKMFWHWLSLILRDKSLLTAECNYQYYQYYKTTLQSTLINEVRSKKWIKTADGKLHLPNEVSLEQLEEGEYEIDYNLIKIFGIEKKTKSLAELGASTHQIEQNERGKLAQKYGFETEEDFKEAQLALKEKRDREAAKQVQHEKSTSTVNSKDEDSNPVSDKMRKTSLDDMSSSTKDYNSNSPHVSKSTDERVQDITQKLADEANRRIEEENKRASVDDLTRYTKIWFETLLDLEYNSSITESDFNRSQIKITFERFRKEQDSSHIYVLSNPSRNIPIWLEEVGGLTVKFTFLNKDDVSFTFDVANVKDFTLRLKAKASDIAAFEKIDWTKCTKAVVEVNNPVEIMSRLKTAFTSLEYSEDYNFRDNLNNNISFVFGPPGTGKTTRLAEIIRTKMERGKCKILVLAPTNKACDVLAHKLIESGEDYSWLGRFVATGDEYIESSGALIDRDSTISEEDRCCVISTIARLPYDGFSQISVDNNLLKDISWDFVIIDEASMIPLVQIIYAIYKLKNSKFIIAGDPLQIAPIIKEKGWMGENIYTMVKLNNFETPMTYPIQFEVEKLDTQYRSVPSIGSLYSNYSYEGKLTHARNESQIKNLNFGKLNIKPISFIPFRVERFDSIFGAKRLHSSNVHIYSAIFAVETCAYIAKQQTENTKIGVICPYAPQAQLINKMIEQRVDMPLNVDISCGTIHGFQGDQCDIILTVLNPPTGIKVAADRIMLNNKNILNVAISRASDYLFVILPHPDSYGYENLIEINKLCKIAKSIKKQTVILNCDEVEKEIFDNPNYIEQNTFVTTHQIANVYHKADCLYEVRIDDNAVDIQLGGNEYSETLHFVNEMNNVQSVGSGSSVITDSDSSMQTVSKIANEELKDNDKENIEENDAYSKCPVSEYYIERFEKNSVSLEDAIKHLISENSIEAIYTLVQIFGNQSIAKRLNWKIPEVSDIKTNKNLFFTYKQTKTLYPELFHAVRINMLPMKGIGKTMIKDLLFEDFKLAFNTHAKRKKSPIQTPPKQRQRASIGGYKPITYQPRKEDSDNLYDHFEYGLSDW